MTREIVVATRNARKAAEIRRLLADLDARWLDLPAGAPGTAETGATLRENAILKAVAAARHTGRWALGDDAGLEIDALGGRPGVRTADHGRAEVLREMEGVERRAARYRAVVVVATPAGEVVAQAEGTMEGVIAAAPRGSGGEGFDAILVLPDGRTVAELTDAEEDRISHRAQALARLRSQLSRVC